MQLNAVRLGLAGGIVWGVSLCLMTLAGAYCGYGLKFLEVMADVYPGYTVTATGSLVGLVIGFFDAFIGLVIFGWLYNRLGGSSA